MSLKDRLKVKEIKKLEQKQEKIEEVFTKQASEEKKVCALKEKLCLALNEKIAQTSKWKTYDEKKQQNLIVKFLNEQITLNYSSIALKEDDKNKLIKEIIEENKTFGILDILLKDSDVSYVLVNGAKNIYVEKDSKLYKTTFSFRNDEALLNLIKNIVAKENYKIDEKNPIIEIRTKAGYLVNAILPPLALDGPYLTIKKIRKNINTLEKLLESKTLSLEILKVLEIAVATRTNIVISGAKASGKTTLLNAFCNKIPKTERLVTIEDADELNLQQKNILRLKTQLANSKETYKITTSDLVKNAIRMRPDRIILEECKGDEAYNILQAMNTGFQGSMATIYADSVADTLYRLEEKISNCTNLNEHNIKKQIANSIELIVHMAKLPNGERKITKISELFEINGNQISIQDIFVWKKEFQDEKTIWEHFSTGIYPRFLRKAKTLGYEVNNIIFDTKYKHTYPDKNNK